MEILQPDRRIQRVRHELLFREVTVDSVERLGGEFIRLVFTGDSLIDFVSLGFDDHVKLIIEDSTGGVVRRDFTPRCFDAARRQLTIDFAIHGEGFASEWARQATVGQHATIGGPRGSMIVPLDYEWHLLTGDATASPAIGRRLAELPPESHAIVVVQLEDLASLELSHSAAQIELRQVDTSHALIDAIRALKLPRGQGYAWAAGEASVMKRVSEVLFVEKQHPREAMRVAAYWKRGASDYHDELGR